MSILKTYILAPNFTFKEDGPIRLGNIIADPFRPTKPLSELDSSLPIPETDTTVEYDRTLGRAQGRSFHGSVWAQFLQTATGSISAKASSDLLSQYTMESLVAKYFKKDPTDEEADRRVKASKKVRASMKAGVLGSQPVYMITGLRIAKGFKLLSDVQATQEAAASASVPIIDKASVGLDAGLSRKDAFKESFRAGDDIIFAYQVHIIAEKGWWKKKVEINIFASQAAFLNDDKKAENEDPIGVSPATEGDLVSIGDQREDVLVNVIQSQNDDEKAFCISFQIA